MFFKLMEVSHHLCGEAAEAFITTELVGSIMFMEFFFSLKGLVASFALKVYICRLIFGFKWDINGGGRERVHDGI